MITSINGKESRKYDCKLRCNLDLILRKDLIETGQLKSNLPKKIDYSFQELPHNKMHAEYKN